MSRDLATLTFYLGGHSACSWCGSLCSVCVPSLNFIGLPVRKILGIYCVSINPPGDLALWPFDLWIGSRVTRMMGFHPAKLGLPRLIFSRVMLRHGTDRQTDRHRGSFYNAYALRGQRHNKRLDLHIAINVDMHCKLQYCGGRIQHCIERRMQEVTVIDGQQTLIPFRRRWLVSVRSTVVSRVSGRDTGSVWRLVEIDSVERERRRELGECRLCMCVCVCGPDW